MGVVPPERLDDGSTPVITGVLFLRRLDNRGTRVIPVLPWKDSNDR